MKKKPTLSEVLQIVKAGFSAIEAKMATKDDLAGLEAKVDNGFTELSDIAGVRADIISIKQDMVDLKAGAFTQAREGGPPRTSQIHRGRSREPHGQAAALAQGAVIAGPIRHLVPLLRDVMTAILVRFEWHDDCPRVKNRAALLYRPLLARQDQSMQQGVPRRIGIELPLSMTVEVVACPDNGTAGGPPRILAVRLNEGNISCQTHTPWRNARASVRSWSTTRSSSAPGFPACICSTGCANWACPRG